MDRTLILVKPDAFARGLTGEIIARFERKGLRIVALKHMQVDEDAGQAALRRARRQAVLRRARRVHHVGPLVAMVLEGDQAVVAARQVIGATNPLEATTGSIRGDFAIAVGQNMVHGSDSPESAAREAALFFPEPGREARPRIGLAAAARILARCGPGVRGRAGRTSTSSPRAIPPRSRARTRGARPRAGRGGGGGARRRHGGRARRADLRQAGRRGRGRGDAARPDGRTHEVVSGVRPGRSGDVDHASATSGPRVTFRAARRRRDRLLRRHRGVARSRRRLRDPGPSAPRSSSASRATTSTSSAFRSPPSRRSETLDFQPFSAKHARLR